MLPKLYQSPILDRTRAPADSQRMQESKDDRTARPGQVIDVVSSAAPATSGDGADETTRPWIGIHFECCGAYTRISRRPEATEYEGRCPKCGLPIRVGVGPDGVKTRLLRARVV